MTQRYLNELNSNLHELYVKLKPDTPRFVLTASQRISRAFTDKQLTELEATEAIENMEILVRGGTLPNISVGKIN